MSRISIFIPTYNRIDLLKVAISSVLNQTYTDYDLHIFDNASSDGTYDLLARIIAHNDKIIYHRNSSNIGASENFKQIFKVASQSSSPFFCVFSDDDFLLPTFLENAIEKLSARSFADFIIMDCIHLSSEYNLIAHAESSGELSEYRNPPKMMLQGVPFLWTSMLFKKSLASIYLKADMKYEIGNDMRFLTLATALHPYIYYSRPGACLVNHDKSFSNSRSTVREGRAYQVIQMHRYVEVINWPDVTKAERLHVTARLKALYQSSISFSFLVESLIAVQKFWENKDAPILDKTLLNLCVALNSEGEYLIEVFVRLLAGSKVLGCIYRNLFYPVLRRRRNKRLSKLRFLQNDRFASEFLSVSKIRADAASL